MFRKYTILAVFLTCLSACQASPTFLEPASPISGHVANLYKIIFYLALAVFVLVEGALVLIVVRDRKRTSDQELPEQVYGNMRLEVIWTVIPLLLVIILFVLTVQTASVIAPPPAQPNDLNLRIVGHRWWWEFDYLDQGVATANELHIPVGKTVQVSLESVDVIHSFWVPQLAGKTDVIPGQHNTMWLKGDREGVYLGQCAEFCGTQHALMRFRVIVESRADFDKWMANQQEPAYQPQTEDEQAGYEHLTGACAPCHSLDPSEVDTTKAGPNLAHLFSRTTFAGGTFDLNNENLRSWLEDTQAMKPGNDMVITIQPEDIDHILSYLTNLK
jgi:cytochrome c oxidase subunit II